MEDDIPVDPAGRVVFTKRATGQPSKTIDDVVWERWLVTSPHSVLRQHGALVSPCRRCMVERKTGGTTYTAYVDGVAVSMNLRSEESAARGALKELGSE